MSTETRIAEIDQRLTGVEKDISEILPRSKDYTDSRFREARLQMTIDQKDAIDKAANVFSKKLDEKMHTLDQRITQKTSWIDNIKTKIVDWVILCAIGGGVIYSAGAKAIIGG